MEDQARAMRPRKQRTFLSETLHVWVLVSFTVAQPIYDLLGRSPEFFIARLSQPGEILALVGSLSLLVPGILVGVLWGLSRLCWSAFVVCQRTFLVGLSAVFILHACRDVTSLSGSVLVGGAVLLSGGVTWLYHRLPPVRQFMTFLTPSLVVFPIAFLFFSPVAKLLVKGEAVALPSQKITASFPIVIVVFDEFPLAALMDEHYQIDAIRYPHFAEFANEATWFRNATTVSEWTLLALPSIITGKYPDRSLLPNAADHPHNLFTLLGKSYTLHVQEARTQLCPQHLCGQGITQSIAFSSRLGALAGDVAVLHLHQFLPHDFREQLPDILQDWNNFIPTLSYARNMAIVRWANSQTRPPRLHDRASDFLHFVETLQPSAQPTFHFLHTMLPHGPYLWLPSGKRYRAIPALPGNTSGRWQADEWAPIQAYQRALLQIGFVDTLFGQLIDGLKGQGLYDQAYIIITADHGVSFRPNDFRRSLSHTNYQDILRIPFFVKKPYQATGYISDRNVETIDIVPTIADALGVSVPWRVDGQSVFDAGLDRPQKTYFGATMASNHARLSFPASFAGHGEWAAVDRKLELFGSGRTKPAGVYPIGSYADLIGLPVSQFPIEETPDLAVRLDTPEAYTHVDLQAAVLPVYISGQLRSRKVYTSPSIAIVVNGTIQAITQPWTVPVQGKHGRWSALVDEASLRSGENLVFPLLVSETSRGITLLRPAGKFQEFREYDPGTQESIISGQGEKLRLHPGYLKGWVDRATLQDSKLVLTGWAADVPNAQLPKSIWVFVNDKLAHVGSPTIPRPGVAHFLKMPLFQTGFTFTLSVEDTNNLKVRVYAVSEVGLASELAYGPGYPFL